MIYLEGEITFFLSSLFKVYQKSWNANNEKYLVLSFWFQFIQRIEHKNWICQNSSRISLPAVKVETYKIRWPLQSPRSYFTTFHLSCYVSTFLVEILSEKQKATEFFKISGRNSNQRFFWFITSNVIRKGRKCLDHVLWKPNKNSFKGSFLQFIFSNSPIHFFQILFFCLIKSRVNCQISQQHLKSSKKEKVDRISKKI